MTTRSSIFLCVCLFQLLHTSLPLRYFRICSVLQHASPIVVMISMRLFLLLWITAVALQKTAVHCSFKTNFISLLYAIASYRFIMAWKYNIMPPSVILSVLDQYINLINKYRFEAIILVSIAHFVIFPNIQLQQLIQLHSVSIIYDTCIFYYHSILNCIALSKNKFARAE